jgi:MFS family permease
MHTKSLTTVSPRFFTGNISSIASSPWVMISLSALFLFYKYVLQVSPGVMTHELMRSFSINAMQLGNLAACYFYSYLIIQIFAGTLLDRWSPRYLTTCAITVCAAGALLFSKAHTLIIAEIARSLMGAGVAFATVSYLKLAAEWFSPQRFSLVAGFLASAAMIGALCGAYPVAACVKLVGWQTTFAFCALLGLLLATLYGIMVRDKSNTQSNSGQTCFLIINYLKLIMLNPQNVLLSIYCGFAFAPVDVLTGLWGIPFLMQSYKLTSTLAAWDISFVFIGFALGAPFIGWLADYFGKHHLFMGLGTGLALITLCSIIYLPALPIIILQVLFFLLGLGVSSFMLGFGIARTINSALYMATVVAFINSFEALWSGLTEPLIGKLLELGWTGKVSDQVHIFSTHDYQTSLSLLPVYLLVALILLLFIKKPNSPHLYAR